MAESKKAKEIRAEFLLKVAANLISAFFVAILILPIGAIVGSAWNGKPVVDPVILFQTVGSTWYGGAFIVFEGLLFLLVFVLKNRAMSIYNELYPDKSG